MNLAVGAGLAAVIAGPPLYALVQAGNLDATTAIERGAVVGLGCAIGASWIGKVIAGYARARPADPTKDHPEADGGAAVSLPGSHS